MRITHCKKKITVLLLTLALTIVQFPITSQATPSRPADVTKADSGNILVRVTGSFERVSKTTILKRINQIRKEACTNRYRNPATGKKLKPSDYVPMKWSSDLEWIAQLRAAECTVYESHTRPNGKGCFSISHNTGSSRAECLAWNYSGLMYGIEQWYGEKNDWVQQNAYAVTGHYTAMINPDYRYIGLGSYVRGSGGWHGVAAEFSPGNSGSQAQSKLKGKVSQTMEVGRKNIKSPKLNAPSSLQVKKTKKLTVTCSISYPGIMGSRNTTNARILKDITWKSSKPSVLAVTAYGKVTAKKPGKATITAKFNGKTFKKTITVKK